MASPQTENGFTRIANEILEVMQMYKFSTNEFKIIMCIWRFTYGFSRKDHQMSLTFITNHTGLSRTRVNGSLKKLLENKVLIKTVEGGANKSNSYSFNKNYEEWTTEKYGQFSGGGSVQNDTTTSVQNDTSVQNVTSVQDDTRGSVQNDTRGSAQFDTQERKNLKKGLKKKEEEPKNAPVDPIIDLLIKNNIVSPGGLNYTLTEDISDVEENFNFDEPEEMISEAIKDAARGNGRTWKFVYNKLNYWRKEGIKSIADLEGIQPQYTGSAKGGNINFEEFAERG